MLPTSTCIRRAGAEPAGFGGDRNGPSGGERCGIADGTGDDRGGRAVGHRQQRQCGAGAGQRGHHDGGGDLTTAGEAFSFNDATQALAVGTVAAASATVDPAGLFAAVSGITTNAADINLQSAGLALNQPVSAGTGTVRLVESGAVSQTAPGTIGAAALSVTDSSGNVVLELGNAVTRTVAAHLTTAGGAFSFDDGMQALAVGTVVAASATVDPAGLFAAVSGITTNAADINLQSAGLALVQPVPGGDRNGPSGGERCGIADGTGDDRGGRAVGH